MNDYPGVDLPEVRIVVRTSPLSRTAALRIRLSDYRGADYSETHGKQAGASEKTPAMHYEDLFDLSRDWL
jgi:hypothetical protein